MFGKSIITNCARFTKSITLTSYGKSRLFYSEKIAQRHSSARFRHCLYPHVLLHWRIGRSCAQHHRFDFGEKRHGYLSRKSKCLFAFFFQQFKSWSNLCHRWYLFERYLFPHVPLHAFNFRV